ncbi:hypothetical protein ISF_02327 [Cordyceps fumosorosea ARSEF 2679]|uniref:Uncharacterized protein n=1 Tax=Cordyceps fumosorosea (strain ARSEF 2679) TaxID=1081104 RepID=A0A168BNS2_CORFA|nr:hypothetical protein ISF_02327 [Cordyceps fumosorosea ARSEF 2679]OAA70353.1 hypothetical protein ISF_02327 [Cordyceps fumosorosea ARSEF 2679]
MSFPYYHSYPRTVNYDDHRYTTKIRIRTPSLSFSSSQYSSSPASSELRYYGYSPRDGHYYNYHHNYCYGGAGPSYPAYSPSWEPSRATRITIETSASGQQYVSIQRSRSGSRQTHHHHHLPPSQPPHHHHHHHEYVRVLRETWNRMLEREAVLDKTNKGLLCEVANLKKGLQAAQAEAHRLCSVVIPQLECQINNLSAENEALRRELQNATGSCGRHHAEIEALRIRICHQDKEIKDLNTDAAAAKEAAAGE